VRPPLREVRQSAALVVAAHGSAEPDVNEGVARLARRVGDRLRFDEATAAFHHGEPGFSEVLDSLRSDDVVVVPLLQSDGYYCRSVLPQALARNRRFPTLSVRRTPPVGVHPAIGELLARRVGELARRHALIAPAIALVAHGTPRHPGSRQAAGASARDLERTIGLPTRAFFLDEEPSVDSLVAVSPACDLIVVPLLIGPGRHATLDLATRLGLSRATGATGAGAAGDDGERIAYGCGRRMLLDRPLGLDPAIEEIVIDLVLASKRPIRSAGSGSPGSC
jgi:sirohydrochlorin cobaltochelatase